MSTEVKVGGLFFLGLVVLLWFTLFVSDVGGSDGEFSVRFPRIEGIESGSPVTYNGVPVGKVSAVDTALSGGIPMVEVEFSVDEDHRAQVLIGEQTRFTIRQGFLGGSSLAILNEGGGKPISADLLAEHVGQPPVSIGDAVEQISSLIEDIRPDLEQTFADLPDAIGNFSGMSAEIRATVAENRERIAEAIGNLRDMGGSIRDFVLENREVGNRAITNVADAAGEFRDLVAENRANVREALEAFPETMANARDLTGSLREVVAENRDNIRTIIENLASFAPKLDRIGSDVEEITDQIASGQGTVGRLVFEDTLHDKAVAAVDSFEQRMEEIEPLTAGFSDLEFYTGLRGGYNVTTGGGYGGAYLRIEPRAWKFYEVGLGWAVAPDDRDTADEDPDDLNIDIDLLFGWRFLPDDDQQVYRLTVAGGLIQSSPGLRIDYKLWGDRLMARAMIRGRRDDFDADDRRFEEGDGPVLRATLHYRLWRRIDLIAGVDDLIDDPDPWVGLSAEILDQDIRNLTTAAGILP